MGLYFLITCCPFIHTITILTSTIICSVPFACHLLNNESCLTHQDCYKVIDECTVFEREAYLDHDKEAQEMHLKDVSELHSLIYQR